MPKGVYIRTKVRKFPKEEYPNFGMRGKTSWIKGLTKETDERIAKMAEKLMGKHRSEITKKKIGKGNSNPSEEARKKMSKQNTGKNNPMYGKHHSEKTKVEKSKVHLKFWQDPEYQKMMAGARALKPNKLEQYFDRITPEYIRYVGDFAFPVKIKTGTRFPDFIIEGQNKALELFGDYYHKDEDPKNKIKEYKEAGWNCIIFWEHEVYNEPERVLKEVLEFIKLK